MNKLTEYWLKLRSYLALTIVLASAGVSYHLSTVYNYKLLLQRCNDGEQVELARVCGDRPWKAFDVYQPMQGKDFYCQVSKDIIAPTKRPKRKRKGP